MIVPARRDDGRLFVVIEAKRGAQRALAKHKLLYPALAAGGWAPERFDRIVPVFVRAHRIDNGLDYSVYECSAVPTDETACLAAVTVECCCELPATILTVDPPTRPCRR